MRFVRGGRPSPSDCARYIRRTATSDRIGPVGAVSDVYGAEVARRRGETVREAFDRVSRQLMTYDIFPPSVIRHSMLHAPSREISQRYDGANELARGTTIVQWFQLGPIAMESAVRVIDTWDRADGPHRCAGFAYATLQGHPECGVATFQVETDGAAVCVELTALSVAGTPLTRLGKPFARMVQRTVTRRALRRLTRQ